MLQLLRKFLILLQNSYFEFSIGLPSKEAKAEIETYSVISGTKISKYLI